jgi:predicted nucleic acid-binding Zn ribbon protein
MQDLFRSLSEVIGTLEPAPAADEPLVFSAWRRVAGAAVEASARPACFVGRELTVITRDETWQRQLSRLAGQYLFQVNAELGRPTVSYIRFDVRPEAFPPVDSGSPLPELVRAAAAIESEELRSAFISAATAVLARRGQP